MKKKTGIIIAVVVVIAAAAGFGGWMYHQSQLDKMRAAGIDALEAGVNLDNYREEQQKEIKAIFKDSEAQINECKDYESIDAVSKEALDEISKIKTDADLDREEGLEELDSLVDLNDYREAEQKEIEKILKNSREKVEKAENQKEIDRILKDTKKKISKIKTDEQLTKEEEEAARKAAEEAAAREAAAKKAKKSKGKKKKKNSGGCVGNDASNFY